MVRLTRHGFREMLIGSLVLVAVAVVLGWSLWWPVSLIVLPVLIWLFAFFRDPERAIPGAQHVMVSPADGTVSDISELPHFDLVNGPAMRIGIFLSVFNVHVNRSPCEAKVLKVEYKKGKFINAMKHDEASSDNESNTIVLGEPHGDRPIVVVKQIVGLIARRIVFTAKEGEILDRGERIGMIKFGSRTELYVAKSLDPRAKVTVGQVVRGGADVLVELGKPVESTRPAKGLDEEFEPLIGRETPA